MPVRTQMGPLPRSPPLNPHTQVRTLTPVSLLTVDRAHFDALMGPLLPAMVNKAVTYLQAAATAAAGGGKGESGGGAAVAGAGEGVVARQRSKVGRGEGRGWELHGMCIQCGVSCWVSC